MQYCIIDLGQHGSGNGFLANGTMPLPAPVLTYNSEVLWQLHKNNSKYPSLMCLKIALFKMKWKSANHIITFFSSFIVHYKLEEQTYPNGRVSYTTEKLGHKYLALVRVEILLDILSDVLAE